jgi:hypothetical protein
MRNLLIILFILLGIKSYAQTTLCASSATSFGYEYMANITINGQYYQGNTNYTGPGYYNYTGTPIPTINAGQNISISFTAQTKGAYQQYFKLWIDFNGNGNLNDAGELVYSHTDVWTGTRSFTSTFTVPTSVFNGQVYARFIMVYSAAPALCGNYSYGNTFDFRTTITGAQDPFSYSGYVYGANGVGIPNIPFQLYSKLKSDATYTLLSNHTTDVNGRYNLTSSRDANLYDFELRLGNLSITSPLINDAQAFNQKVLSQSFVSKDYYRMDVNGDNNLSITDVYLTFMRIIGRSWRPGVPNYRIFTVAEWNVINASSSNLKNTYTGQQSVTTSGLTNRGSTNFYLIRTGHNN